MSWADGQILVDPVITLDGIDFTDATRSVMVTAEDDEVSDPHFNGPHDTIPGATKWTIEATMQLTYGAEQVSAGTTVDAGTWNTLQAMRKTRVACVVSPNPGALGDATPQATVDVYVGTPTFVDGEAGAGETQSITVKLMTRGEPVFATS